MIYRQKIIISIRSRFWEEYLGYHKKEDKKKVNDKRNKKIKFIKKEKKTDENLWERGVSKRKRK